MGYSPWSPKESDMTEHALYCRYKSYCFSTSSPALAAVSVHIAAIPLDARQYLIIFIFLMTYDMGHLFICLFAFCVSSL